MVRERIERELIELDEEARLGDAGTSVVELDQQSIGRLSRMDALQVQAMAKAQMARRQARRATLEAAVRRLDDRTFGLCADCDEPIEQRRLDFDVTIRLCLDCQRG